MHAPPLSAPPSPYCLFGNPVPSASMVKARRTLARYAKRFHFDPTRSYPLVAERNATVGPLLGLEEIKPAAAAREGGAPLRDHGALVIGTLRMGYGHYRMGLAIASAAHAKGLTPYFFDLLAFDSPGAHLIRYLERWYNRGSRLANALPLFNRFVWEPLTGPASPYRRLDKNLTAIESCRIMTDVYAELPPALPFVATHPFPGNAAVHAGRDGVVNLVPDNCPLGFMLVPGALNTVQGPQAHYGYRTLLGMGPGGAALTPLGDNDLALVGHYVDHELVSNLAADTEARRARAQRGEPRRLLLSVGGAGAQRRTYARLLAHLLPATRAGRAAVLLNVGSHAAVWEKLQRAVPGLGAAAVLHRSWPETLAFVARLHDGALEAGLHVFLHDDLYAAIYTTNLLMRVSDLLVTKPSELSYYPIPKLFTERIGGHEAFGAIRAAELGDGSPELADVQALLAALDDAIARDAFVHACSERILTLERAGVYDGAYHVIDHAVARAAAASPAA